MNIIDPDAFLASIWDWSFLNNCFPGTKIRVTDIDGFVERNGNFLWFETKGIGKDIPLGQMIMFKRLSKDHNFTVMIIWGKPNEPQRAQFIGGGKEYKSFDCDLDRLHEIVARWFLYANKQWW